MNVDLLKSKKIIPINKFRGYPLREQRYREQERCSGSDRFLFLYECLFTFYFLLLPCSVNGYYYLEGGEFKKPLLIKYEKYLSSSLASIGGQTIAESANPSRVF